VRFVAGIAAAALSLSCAAQDSSKEIQRALIQRDQQSAEFAAGARGGDRAALENLHARQLLEITTPGVERHLQPYQRQKMAEERTLVLPPPVIQQSKAAEKPALSPSPLPRGPEHVVDPIPAQGTPH
jgi:hypothetical protein